MCDRHTVYALSRLIPNCFFFNGLCDDEFQPFVNVDKFLNIKYIEPSLHFRFSSCVLVEYEMTKRSNERMIEWAARVTAVKVESAPIKIATHWTSNSRIDWCDSSKCDEIFFSRKVDTPCMCWLLQSRTFILRLPLICVPFLGCWSATIAKHVRFLFFSFFRAKGAAK